MKNIYKKGDLISKAKALYAEERNIKRLDGWFIAKEIEMKSQIKYSDCSDEVKKARLLCLAFICPPDQYIPFRP